MPPASLNTRMRLSSSMKACASARLAEPGRFSTQSRSPLRTIRRDRPVTSATMVGAEALHDLVERALHRGKRGEPLDQPVAALDGVAALHGLAVAIDRPRGQVALAIGERLEELRREAVRQVVEHVLARRDVDLHVAPFLGRDVGKATLHQRLAGGDDLDDGGMAGLQIALDRPDQRRRLHRGDQVREEALLGGLEGRARRGLRLGVERAALAGDVGGLQGGVEVVVDDLEGAGIGVVDADLLGRERRARPARTRRPRRTATGRRRGRAP